MEKRYSRSIGTLSEEEITKLGQLSVAIVGCGGLGGTVLELLGRMGIGRITAIDGDVFEESNLNRQLLSTTPGVGQRKVDAAKERMAVVNPAVEVVARGEWLTAHNAASLLMGHDLIVDALDAIDGRFLIQATCEAIGLPFVHGAIGGWYGQVAVIYPGDRLLERLYPEQIQRGIEASLGNPSYTPALVASVQAAEAVKVLLGKGEILRRRVLRLDLLEHEYTVIPFHY